jgi:acyl carrier protein|tara:strand:+ start:149 stop:412 length:264 start_codon:yes stop_codon:yes gene_type:complete
MSITNKDIKKDLISYLKKGNPVLNKMKELPTEKSLVELGYMDSFGVIDVVTYLEKKWSVKIEDSEITKEKFGSISKMADLIFSKIKI